MRTDTPPLIKLEDYRAPSHLIDEVYLDVQLHETETIVRSVLTIRPNPDAGRGGSGLSLDAEHIDITNTAIDDVDLPEKAYHLTERGINLHAIPNSPCRLQLTGKIKPDDNTRLVGLYRSNGVYCTQCEAEGFRQITPFIDRPDILSTYTTRIEADKAACPILLSNGNLKEAGECEGTGRHYALWHDPFPKPSYLFALVAGDLAHVSDTFETMSGKTVSLGIYVEQGKEGQCAFAMDALKRSMRWDEKVYGREYDLDVFNIVAVSDFNMGAMENKGLNIFNDKFILANPEIATDEDYANIEAIIAHEYFHNWTGNRITCRDWFQLCLKEGLTVFRDQEFTSDERSRPVKRIEDVRRLRSQQFPEDAGPLAHPVRPSNYREINNFYTATVYEKGAEIVRMIKIWIGDDAFYEGLTLFFDRHDGTATTVEAFVACFEEASGESLSDFMRWYEQAGTPTITATGTYDADAQTFVLTLDQSTPPTPGQPNKLPVPIPVRACLLNPSGGIADMACDDLPSDNVIRFAEASKKLVFTGLSEAPIASLFQGFSAPIELIDDRRPSDLISVLKSDPDSFNRWDAAQRLASNLIFDQMRQPEDRELSDLETGDFLDSLMERASDETLDPAFRAYLLSLPGESDIANLMPSDIDPETIHQARTSVLQRIAKAHSDTLTQLCGQNEDKDVFSTHPQDAARRMVHFAALRLLCHAGQTELSATLLARYEGSLTMTHRATYLTMLVGHGDSADIEHALKKFETHYYDEPLALDKWFGIQAQSPQADCIENVLALLRHPQFSLRNPNRIRALLGRFTLFNQRNFNAYDGRGYSLVADNIGTIDTTNPQVAARLANGFRNWRRLEPHRRNLAKTALENLTSVPGLSRDLAEMLERLLQ